MIFGNNLVSVGKTSLNFVDVMCFKGAMKIFVNVFLKGAHL